MEAKKTLLEQAEDARQAGKRDLCLKLKRQAADEALAAKLAVHAERVKAAGVEYPAGKYIPEAGASVVSVEDGHGTQSGWVSIKLSNGKTMTPAEIKRKIWEANEAKRVNAHFAGLKCPASGRVYIGEYDEALDDLIKYMALDRITGLVEMSGLCADTFFESYKYAYDQAIADGQTDDKAVEAGQEAEQEAQDEDYREYKKKVICALNRVLQYAELELVEGDKGRYYIAPAKDWHASADKMAEVISGYGTFDYKSGRELKDIGSYSTYSRAVIEHLHWLKHGPEIYGDRGYSAIFN